MSRTLVLPESEQLEALLLDANKFVESNDWSSLWSLMQSAPPLVSLNVVAQLRAANVQVDASQYPELQNLIAGSRHQSKDFEQLGRPTNEQRFHGYFGSADEIVGSPDGRYILQRRSDGVIAVPLDSLERFKDAPDPPWSEEEKPSPVFSPDGRYYAMGGQYLDSSDIHNQEWRATVSIYKTELSEPVFQFEGTLYSSPTFVFLSNERLLVTGASLSKTPPMSYSNCIDLRDGSISSMPSLPQDKAISAVSSDGQFALIADNTYESGGGCCAHQVASVKLVNFADGKIIRSGETFSDKIHSARFSADGSLVIVEWTNCLHILDSETFERKGRIQTASSLRHRDRVKCALRNDILAVFVPRDEQPTSQAVLSILSLPDMTEQARFDIPWTPTPGGRSDRAYDARSVTFCGERIFVDTDSGWLSYAIGGRGDVWKHATPLRRVSCTPLSEITEDQRNFVRELSEQEKWLTDAQRNWLSALNALLATCRRSA